MDATATKVGHTPGPWSVRTIPQHGDIKDGEAIVADSIRPLRDPWFVVEPGAIWGRSLAEVNANSKLLAAAPELLAALQGFLSMPYPCVGQDMSYQTAQDIQVFRNLAREAIAKATA